MASTYISRRSTQFAMWWRAPATRGDRVRGALVGVLAGFWLGLLGRLAFVPPSVSFAEAVLWAGAGAIVGLLLGLRFPKLAACVLFPVATFGGGQ
jgi:hypothetical protein